MTTMAPERYSFTKNTELRARNKALVTEWFSKNFILNTHPASDGAESYQPHVRYQRNFLPEGRREYSGVDAVTAQLQEQASRVTQWSWTDLEILASDYPQVIWAFASASYRVIDTGIQSENSYAFAFVLEDSKIRLIKEWSNPLTLLQERGIDVPSAQDL